MLYPPVEVDELCVEILIVLIQTGKIILDGLEEADPAISEGNQSLAIVLDLIIGVRVGFSDLNVPIDEIAERPYACVDFWFFIERYACDVGG